LDNRSKKENANPITTLIREEILCVVEKIIVAKPKNNNSVQTLNQYAK
jgi:hypothetical protein